MKKLIALALCLTMIFALSACSKGGNEGPDTQGEKLFVEFKNEIESSGDINAAAEKVAAASELSCQVQDMTEGFFPGFSTDVTGFKTSVGIFPIIGSIPFVCYIFEAENPDTFAADLTETADPRWNICTEAEETICRVVDNYVFFAMCPGEDAW